MSMEFDTADLARLFAAGNTVHPETVGVSSDSEDERRALSSRRSSGPFAFVFGLTETFGWKLIFVLFTNQHMLKGFMYKLALIPVQFICASLNITAPQMQVYTGIAILPWAMKPIIGLLSDAVPIMGYRKGPYMIAVSCSGVIGASILAFGNLETIGVETIVLSMFFVSMQVATCDLLSEAKYAERMRALPERGPDLMTFVWWGLSFAEMLAILLVTPLMTHMGTQAPYRLGLPMATSVVGPVLANHLEEPRLSPEEAISHRREIAANPVSVFLCCLMFVGTTLLTVVGVTFKSVELNATIATSLALVLLATFSVTLGPLVAKVFAFFLIQTSLNLPTTGASFYFFTDTPDQYPEGPHFSPEFFVSVLGMIALVFSLVGILVYNRYMQTWTYRRLLWVSNTMAFTLSLLDVLVFTRTNLKLGISDHAFVIGASVSQTVISQWMWMPGVLFLSQLCPSGMEATMYALLAGCHNLGNTIAATWGAMTLKHLDVEPCGGILESHQFDNLWKASAMSSCLSFTTCALLPWFIPDVCQKDKLLLDEAEKDPSHGSLWRKWYPKNTSADSATCSLTLSQGPLLNPTAGSESPR